MPESDPTRQFFVRFLKKEENTGNKVIMISDLPLEKSNEKLSENFLKFADQVVLISPIERTLDNISFDRWLTQGGSLPEIRQGDVIVVMGKISPSLIEHYEIFRNATGFVFINPVFVKEIAPKLASVETPCLVITSTPGNLDHDPDSVRYHDLIAGSRIQYVRGLKGNPLYLRFTQSFNAIQRFLANE